MKNNTTDFSHLSEEQIISLIELTYSDCDKGLEAWETLKEIKKWDKDLVNALEAAYQERLIGTPTHC